MTLNETLCLAKIKSWRRKALWRRLKYGVLPILPGKKALRNSGVVIHTLYVFFLIAFSPIIIFWWTLRAALSLVVFPIEYLKTLTNIKKIRAPGERNIQGVHHAFSKHFDLPVNLYLNCVDDWIRILYSDQPEFKASSIKQHIDPQIIDYREQTEIEDHSFHEYAKSQVSRAREEVSKELGFYR